MKSKDRNGVCFLAIMIFFSPLTIVGYFKLILVVMIDLFGFAYGEPVVLAASMFTAVSTAALSVGCSWAYESMTSESTS